MEQTTVRNIVADDFRTAAIFEKYSIDFCCHGNVPLEDACKQQGVSVDQVRLELGALVIGTRGEQDSFASWDLDRLADYVIDTHHKYVKSIVPTLLAHTQKVASVHGERHAELLTIRDIFKNVAEELTQHMMKEELMLFPYIKSLARSARDGQPVRIPQFQTIQNPIRLMEAEHVSAGNGMDTIRQESEIYSVPSDACTTYRVTYQELEAFELDLHKHVHLENNILFPKAILLEQRLFHAMQSN
jgi:regulator of cell morphogenesis and NO signaling